MLLVTNLSKNCLFMVASSAAKRGKDCQIPVDHHGTPEGTAQLHPAINNAGCRRISEILYECGMKHHSDE